MPELYKYRKGDIVRVVQSCLAAPEGTEGKVMKVYCDSTDTVAALDILIAPDPANTRGTRVFPNEVVLVRTCDSVVEAE